MLPQLPPSLSTYTQVRLSQLGVEVSLQTKVARVTVEAVCLQDGRRISTATVVWAAGVRGHSPLQEWGLPTTHNGKVAVLSNLRISGYSNAYVVGDLAELIQGTKLLPMLAPVAIAQGKVAARNILRQIRGQHPVLFRYHHKGTMAMIGRHAAVAQIGRLALTGLPAWLLWLSVHLAVLTGIRHRLLTLLTWLWNYCLHDRVARLILVLPVGSIPQVNPEPSVVDPVEASRIRPHS